SLSGFASRPAPEPRSRREPRRAKRRRGGARADPRARPPNACLQLRCRRWRLAQGRALPEDRFVQGPGRDQPDPHPERGREAAREEGIGCVVEMWESASAFKIERTRAYGGTVDLSPPDPSAAYDRALELVESEGRVFVHPHSDPFVVAGHGTLALELLEDVPE